MCDKCVLIDTHAMYVLHFVDKPIKKTVASESNQKPRNITRKLYERVSKTCSWWYFKFTPSGYIWKPKSGTGNINPNLIEIVLFIVDSGCSKHMTGNLKLLINFVEKFLGTVKFGNDQIASILGYGGLVQGAVTIKRWLEVAEEVAGVLQTHITGQSVQTMNMLNNKCRTSFAKHEFLKKAQRANPRLYDIGCYNDNLALMFAPDSDEVIRLEKEIRSKLSDLIRPFDYVKLNNLYDLFVPQREKSSEQWYFLERSRLSHKNYNNGKSKESFNKQTTLLEKRMDESIPLDKKCQSSIELFKVKTYVNTIINGVELCKEKIANRTYITYIDPFIQSTIESNFSPTFRSQLEKTQFLNEIDRLSREYYYVDHMNAILGVYTELDELQQCKEKIKNEMLFKVNQTKDFCKEREQYFEIQDLKAQLQDKGIVISELKKLIEKLKGKCVDTKFEKSSVIQQPNAFKSQRPSVLGKPTTFSNSFVRKDFLKSKSVTQTNVSNEFSKPVTVQTLPPNKKFILNNTKVLAPGMYKLHTNHNQTRTSQLPQDSRKTNKRVSFSTGVILTTSVSRPQLKTNLMRDRVMHNNSQGKKQEVEDQSRNVKLPKNKTSVTACNDSLNAKTLNVNFVSAMCDKCVLIDTHAMYVLHFVDKPIKKTVASESNQKPRNITRKLYERVKIVLFIVDSGCSKHMMRNLKLLINFVEKFLGTVKFRNDQIAHILRYGDLVQGVVTIKRVYYVEGLNHNLFFVGQFCDADLEVAFRKSTCFIRDLKGNDLQTGSRGTDLYSIILQDTNCPNCNIPSVKKIKQINKIEFINTGGIDSESEEIEDFLNEDLIQFGIEDSPFNMDKDILFLEKNRSQSTEPINDNSSNPLSDESTMKSDYFDEFYGPFIPIYILEEEITKREHTDYIN
nr:integrase, catalytic region, zinc finger, CCHC-type, peptidase aspartic, catalytic [Tanacetum cinerariifolium]